MQRPASELFAPLEEYYPHRLDYRNTAHHRRAIDVWDKGRDPLLYLRGMTPKAQRRFPESRRKAGAFPAGQVSLTGGEPMNQAGGGALPEGEKQSNANRGKDSTTANPFDGFDLYGGAVAIVLALILAVPAFAQDTTGSLSDEALQRETDRLGTYRNPEGRHFGYRGRVRSSDYQVEKQMQQLDQQRYRDDLRQRDLLLREQSRRQTARKAAEMARYDAEIEARNREAARQTEQSMERLRAMGRTMDRELEQQRQESDAWAREQQAKSDAFWAERSQRHEAEYQRSRELMHRQANPHLYAPPRQPAPPMQPLPGAHFPPVRQVMPPPDRRTPREAYQEGQQLGAAIGEMIVGIRDRDKRKRRDAIVQRYFEGTITREDYAQLAQDGYTDLALELIQAERR